MFPYIGLLTHCNSLEHLMTCLHHIENIKFCIAVDASSESSIINVWSKAVHTLRRCICAEPTNKQIYRSHFIVSCWSFTSTTRGIWGDALCWYLMHLPQSQPITSSEPSDLSTDPQSVQAASTDKRNSAEHCYICAPSCVITLGSSRVTPRLASTWTIEWSNWAAALRLRGFML